MENKQAKTVKATAPADKARKPEHSHFKRELVPLDEYAAREGLSSDIVEKQGQLGVIQIRKFKGQKFVVDVPVEQLNEFEGEESFETTRSAIKRRSITSPWLTKGLTSILVIIIVSLFLLYINARTQLESTNAEYLSLLNKYNDITNTNQNIKAIQDELAGSKSELNRTQNLIASSRSELETIRDDLNKTRQNLERIQSELSGIQGQISLSKVEIESIQNELNGKTTELDTLYRQNSE